MSDAFISYRRVPSASLARQIQTRLQYDQELNIYLDVTRRDGMFTEFPEYLLDVIRQSSVFICILAEGTLDSDWIRREIRHAYELNKPCIPIFEDGYRHVPSAHDEVSITYLLSFDALHANGQSNVTMDDFFDALAKRVKTLKNSHKTLIPIKLKYPLKRQAISCSLSILLFLGLIFVGRELGLSNSGNTMPSIAFPTIRPISTIRPFSTIEIPVLPTRAPTIALTGEYYLEQGHLDVAEGDYYDALVDYTASLMISPDSAVAYYHRGMVYAELEANTLALEDYIQAIRLDPEHGDSYFKRGQLYARLDEHLSAIKDYNRALDLNPDELSIYHHRGVSYVQIGDCDLASVDLKHLLINSPDDSTTYQELEALLTDCEAR